MTICLLGTEPNKRLSEPAFDLIETTVLSSSSCSLICLAAAFSLAAILASAWLLLYVRICHVRLGWVRLG